MQQKSMGVAFVHLEIERWGAAFLQVKIGLIGRN
jgi:hypothetical protein